MDEISWKEDLNAKRLKSEGWYGCIAPDGWQKIVEETDEMLAYVDPDYEINQVKEKFGTLRYYFSSNKTGVEAKIMHAITAAAESKSARTCEICGKYGELRDSKSYIRTLCEECESNRSD
jgi:hypothetical protein